MSEIADILVFSFSFILRLEKVKPPFLKYKTKFYKTICFECVSNFMTGTMIIFATFIPLFRECDFSC